MSFTYRALLHAPAGPEVDDVFAELESWSQKAERHSGTELEWTNARDAASDVRIGQLRSTTEQSTCEVLVVSDGDACVALVEQLPLYFQGDRPTAAPVPDVVHRLVEHGPWQAVRRQFRDPQRLDAAGVAGFVEGGRATWQPAVLLLAAGDRDPRRVLAAFEEHLLGLVNVALVDPTTLHGFARDHGLGSAGRVNSAVLIVQAQGSPRYVDLPATVVSAQPAAAARRLQREVFVRSSVPVHPLITAGRRSLRPEQSLDEQVLEELTDELQRREEVLETEVQSLREERESLQEQLHFSWLEQQEILQAHDDAQARITFLERRLREQGIFAVAEPIMEETSYLDVESCGQVLELVRETLEHLSITADRAVARQLDEHPKAAVWARKAWDWLRALDDYVRVKAEGVWQGNLMRYCTDPPPACRTLPTIAYAPRESESTETSPQLVRARTFPVPETVDDSGRARMMAHLKIDRGGSPAPRVHFYDDTGKSGRLVVGYFGPHLPL
jgi:hypothetical protein